MYYSTLAGLIILSMTTSTNTMQDNSPNDSFIKLSPRNSRENSLKKKPKLQVKDMTAEEEKVFHKNREESSPQTLLRRESANRINAQKQRIG